MKTQCASVIYGAGILGCTQPYVANFCIGAFLAFNLHKICITLFFFFPHLYQQNASHLTQVFAGSSEFFYLKVCLTTFAVPSCFPVFKFLLKDEILVLIAIAPATLHSQVPTLQDPLIRPALELISL